MKTKPQILWLGMAAGLLASGTLGAPLGAAEPQNADQNAATAREASPDMQTQAYLGVGVENLHPSLASHLANRLGAGRGVLVSEVASGSPAERAGLKTNDVIVSFDDQRIYSPEQLVQLVRHAKTGSEATLGVVRSGENEQQIKATLGEHQVAATRHRAFRMPSADGRPRLRDDAANWSSFDEMTLTRTDDKHFKAEIKFRDQQGKIDTRTFQGTRDDIRRDIDNQKDLPQAERDHLLRALNLRNGQFELEWPGISYDTQ